MFKCRCRWFLAVFLLQLLAACGGGGASMRLSQDVDNPKGGKTPSPSPVPVFSPTPNVSPEPVPSSTSTPVAFPGSGGEKADSDGLPTAPEPFFYFSYDDSASTASRDLSIMSIQQGIKPFPSWGRAYEFLNAERFSHFNAQQVGLFEVSAGLQFGMASLLPSVYLPSGSDGVYALGVNISGPKMTLEKRKNLVLTLLIDVSGSMSDSYAPKKLLSSGSLMDVVKEGLQYLPESLKPGDVINVVTFSTEAQTLLEGYFYTDENVDDYIDLLGQLIPQGRTNLDAGISRAYELAGKYFDETKANRVVMLTDAYANRGEVDATIVAEKTQFNNAEGIYFAGIGIGAEFNDAFLNELTEAGKGVYSAMVTLEDAERIFTDGFMRFVDNALLDVRFKLEYPDSLVHLSSAAEEFSRVESDIQSVNFSYNDSQFFLELFTPTSESHHEETVRLEVSYQGPLAERVTEVVEWPLSELLGQGESQILGASAVTALAGLIKEEFECSDVLGSELYALDSQDQLYLQYRNWITLYCGL